MKQQDQHISFTAADIERYHTDALSMQERHALEKAALDDPFLADALEGYANTNTPQADLIEIQQRLSATTSKRKRGFAIPLLQHSWLRIAALVLLLAGAGWTIYRFTSIQTEELAASEETTNTNSSFLDSGYQNKTLMDSATLTESATPQQDAAASLPAIPSKNQQSITLQQQKDKAADPVGIVAAPAAPIEAVKEVEQQNAEDRSVARARQQTVASNSPRETNLNTFRGQIVDPNGNPVPYANIVDNRSRNATTTNTQGQFFLTTPDSVVNATVAAVGFQSNKVNMANPAKEQKVILNQANASLEEVVVTGYGKKRARSNTRPSDITTKAEVEELEPEGGWSGFNNYISENLQIPEDVAKNQVKGEVQLSFEVDKNGNPVNIKVAKSLCEACDKEAIRLLKEGPGWKKKKKKAGKVSIRF